LKHFQILVVTKENVRLEQVLEKAIDTSPDAAITLNPLDVKTARKVPTSPVWISITFPNKSKGDRRSHSALSEFLASACVNGK
jgi:hypothetical protein